MEPTDLLDMPLIVSRQTFVDDVLSKWSGTNFEKYQIFSKASEKFLQYLRAELSRMS